MTYNDRKPTIISASQNGSIYRCLGIWVHRKAQKNRTAQNSAKIIKDSQTDTMLYEVVNHDCLYPRYLNRLCVCVSWTLGTPRFMICFNFSRHLYLWMEKKNAQQAHPWGGPPCWKVVTQWSPLRSPHRRWTLRWWMCPRRGRESGEWSDAWKDTKCTCFKIVISYSILFHIHPGRLNMEPQNHPFGKEHDLPNLHDYVPC